MAAHLPPFRVAVVHADGATTLEVSGEVDLATAPDLATRLEAVSDASVGDVSVDLTQVTFLDSSGLIVLVTAHRRLLAVGRRLFVCNPSSFVRRVLELSGANDVLDVRREPVTPAAGD